MAYLVFNNVVAEKLSKLVANWREKDVLKVFANATEAAAGFGLPVDSFIETLKTYNAGVEKKEDSFGKTIFPTTLDPNSSLCT